MSEKRVHLNSIRRYIAEKLRHSICTHPQASHFCHTDATKMLELKEKLAKQGEKVSVTAIVTAAISYVLMEMPLLNSRIEGDDAIYYDQVNPAIAVNSARGLYVLTLPNAQDLGVVGVAHGINELRRRLNNNEITRDDMFGSTVTITSLGKCRTNICTSIINNDECLIIGVGNTQKEAVVDENGEIVARDMLWLCINYNHSLTDGTPISHFCDRLCEVVEDPEKYLKI